MFSEDAATDDGKPPEQQQQQPPAVERSFMRSNDNSAASKPPNSGIVYGYLALLLDRTKCYIELCGNSFFRFNINRHSCVR